MTDSQRVTWTWTAFTILAMFRFPFQNLTKCKCKAFFGSLAEIKGNEARVVFFLHPIGGLHGGQVSKSAGKNWLPRIRSTLFAVGSLLALGALAYVIYRFTNKQFVRLDQPFATFIPAETTISISTTTIKTVAPITKNNTLATPHTTAKTTPGDEDPPTETPTLVMSTPTSTGDIVDILPTAGFSNHMRENILN